MLMLGCNILSDADLVTFNEAPNTSDQELSDLARGAMVAEESLTDKPILLQKNHSYVSQSAVALRCRVMPPPCLRNPYLEDASDLDVDRYSNQRSKCAGALYFCYCGAFLLCMCADSVILFSLGMQI